MAFLIQDCKDRDKTQQINEFIKYEFPGLPLLMN